MFYPKGPLFKHLDHYACKADQNDCKTQSCDANLVLKPLLFKYPYNMYACKVLKLPDVLTWCEGDGCLLSSAWCGNVLAIFLATQWLANIIHSATVSWTPRCSFGLMLSTTLLASNSNWTSDPDSSLEERERVKSDKLSVKRCCFYIKFGCAINKQNFLIFIFCEVAIYYAFIFNSSKGLVDLPCQPQNLGIDP